MTTTPFRSPRLLAVDDVAERLQLSSKTVRRSIDRGELAVHRLGHRLRISEADLAAFLAMRRE